MSKKIYLIDGNSFIYRMFFALPEFSTKDGRIVNATFWMAKFFMGQLVKEKPDYLIFIKDAKGENFRHKIYSEYKATREKMPDNLRSQISDIEEMIMRMWIEIIEISWYEADDVIGTLSEKLKRESKNEIFILSWDKDLYALVDEQVKIYDTQRKKISGLEETFEKFWVPADCVRDYLAICGDTSDNIPGISWIWPKKAQVLLLEFKTLEAIYIVIDDIGNQYNTISSESQKILKGKTLEKFIEGRKNAFLSQKLATLDCNVEMSYFNLEDFSFNPKEIQTPEVFSFFEELEFHSLLDNRVYKYDTWESTGKQVKIIGDELWLLQLKDTILKWNSNELIIDTETSSLNTRQADLLWISLLYGEEIFYINLWHRGSAVNKRAVQDFLRYILDSQCIIIGHNLKYDLQIMKEFLHKNFNIQERKVQQNLWQLELWI